MIIIILGSKSDLEWGELIGKYLSDFGIPYKLHVASAHKTPEYLLTLLKRYETLDRPIVYICVAGRSNALGGFVDAQVVHPVINCPPSSDKFAGLDILSSLRMPSGVACLTVLEPEQAALAAAKILSESDQESRKKISLYQKSLKERIIVEDRQLK